MRDFDVTVPHSARVLDYFLGGKDHYAADREAGDWAIAAFPRSVNGVRASRAFLARAVRYLAGELGIRQFLDVGTGIPKASDTHVVAQAVAPESRIVYVDNDPEEVREVFRVLNSSRGPEQAVLRDRVQVERFFTGFDLVPPGLVNGWRWRPGDENAATDGVAFWAGAGRKPW
jgi:hypothetical protein